MAIMRKLSMVVAGGALLALGAGGSAQAASVVLDFEGIGDFTPVGEFYNTAPNDFDISFSSNALALVDEDAGGSGNVGGEPSPDTVLFFLDGPAATLNAPNGFTTGFSFFYSAINEPGSINVYEGVNSTGTLLTTLNLPLTPDTGAPDPTGNFSPLIPIGVTFAGTARSVDFGGSVNQIVFDDITIGSAIPGPEPVPEPSSVLGTLAFGVLGIGSVLKGKLKRKQIKQA